MDRLILLAQAHESAIGGISSVDDPDPCVKASSGINGWLAAVRADTAERIASISGRVDGVQRSRVGIIAVRAASGIQIPGVSASIHIPAAINRPCVQFRAKPRIFGSRVLGRIGAPRIHSLRYRSTAARQEHAKGQFSHAEIVSQRYALSMAPGVQVGIA